MNKTYIKVKDVDAVRDMSNGSVLFTDKNQIRQARIRNNLKIVDKKKDETIMKLEQKTREMNTFIESIIKRLDSMENGNNRCQR